jgi:hypothetical protein
VAGDDVTITIRADSGDVVRAFRDVEGRLRDTRGRFVSEGSIMSRAMSQLSGSIGSLIPVATAAVPAAAALGLATAKAAGSAGGAVTALAAFGVAVAGQVGHLSDASKAQEKYSDSVAKYGRGSRQAAEAQRAVQASFASMPQSTARAAVALGTLKDTFHAWSDEMADFTMGPVEKSFAVLGQLVPKLTPMVKGASAELDRLVTVAGGAITTPGFDALTEKFSTFANSALKDAVDGVIHFTRVLSEGQASGPIRAFMEYAESNGPAVRELLSSISDAVTTFVQAAAEAGPGMLTLVNAAAKLVASLPPEVVATLMQTAVALKLVTLAGAGVAAVAGGIATLSTRLTALSAASTAAGGGLAGLRAAFLSLGTAAKASVIVGGLALLALGIKKLADGAKGAPPDVDKLTTSLKQLASTGKFTGELKKTFGDMDGLVEKIKQLRTETEKSQETALGFRVPVLDDVADWAADSINNMAKGSESLSALKDDFAGLDQAMAGMVASGNGELAAQGFESIKAAALAEGHSLAEVNALFPEYSSAVADAAFEQKLAVESMGIFGAAAQDTSAKLEAQKGAADGLRASILALNDVNRSAYDAQIDFEAAVDGLSESFKENGATLDIATEAGRKNGEAMSAAAKSRDEMIASGLAAGESLASMTKKSDSLRESMLKLATEAFGGNKKAAQEYVDTLLGTPDQIATLVKLEREEAITGLEEVRTAIRATPGAKEVVVSTLNASAIRALEAVGYKTEQLPDGRTRVYTANGQALSSIGAVSAALNKLDGDAATTYVNTIYTKEYRTFRQMERDSINGTARGGRVRGYAMGGDVQIAPTGLLSGPGTGTSDSILALFASGAVGRVSDTEYVVNAQSTRKYLPLLEAINSNRLRIPGFAGGGLTKGQMKGLSAPSDLSALYATLSEVRTRIKERTSGRTESRLLRTLDSVGKKLVGHEKALSGVNKALEGARTKLNDLKSAASQLASGVKGTILGEAGITRLATGEDSRLTINTILSQMTGSAQNASEFDSALKMLKKRGLSSALLQQIAEAGVTGGGLETAQALLGASAGQLKTLNGLQGQLTKSATSAGAVTADAVYGEAIRKQTDAVNRLQKSQDRLERAMSSLAAALNKAIIRATGKASGGIVGMAASGGIRSNRTWVGEHGPELLDLPAGSRVWSNPDSRRMVQASWASMLNTPRRGPSHGSAPAAPAAGSGRPLVVELHIGGRKLGEVMIDPLREAIHHRGGNVQATLGKGDG